MRRQLAPGRREREAKATRRRLAGTPLPFIMPRRPSFRAMYTSPWAVRAQQLSERRWGGGEKGMYCGAGGGRDASARLPGATRVHWLHTGGGVLNLRRQGLGSPRRHARRAPLVSPAGCAPRLQLPPQSAPPRASPRRRPRAPAAGSSAFRGAQPRCGTGRPRRRPRTAPSPPPSRCRKRRAPCGAPARGVTAIPARRERTSDTKEGAPLRKRYLRREPEQRRRRSSLACGHAPPSHLLCPHPRARRRAQPLTQQQQQHNAYSVDREKVKFLFFFVPS